MKNTNTSDVTIVTMFYRAGTSDKQYSVFLFNNTAITMWGRRGNNMRIKEVSHEKAVTLISKKLAKGYKMDSKRIETSYRALQTIQMYAPKYANEVADMVNEA